MPSPAAGQGPSDPASVISAVTDAINAGDVETALAWCAEDATYTALPATAFDESMFAGKARIRTLAEAVIGQHSRTLLDDVQVDGERVEARARTVVDSVRRLGGASLAATAVAIVRDGKIQSATYMFTPEAAGLLQAVRSGAAATAQIPQAQEPIDGALTGGDDAVPHQTSG